MNCFCRPIGYYPVHLYSRPLPSSTHVSVAKVAFSNRHRLLWEQHVYWTRMAIISLVFNLPDTEFVLTRLLRNAPEMGNLLRPYFGDAVADEYSRIIKEHLSLAAELVKAVVAGNTEQATKLEKDWYRNADEWAVFLNKISPYIDLEEMRMMLYDHLAMTKMEAISMNDRNFELSIEVFDRIELQALAMADMISEGVFKMFPSVFS